jgi:hypothetical protein
MATGDHGLSEISPGPAMPNPSGRLRGNPLAGAAPCGRFLLPLQTPHAVRLGSVVGGAWGVGSASRRGVGASETNRVAYA